MVGSAVDKGVQKYSGTLGCNDTIFTTENVNGTNVTKSSITGDCDKEVKLQVAMAVTLMVGIIQVSG